ncbi:MAG: hypothetical protein IJK52_13635 [Oscillospiraceae bacterium]|nr:hypothetical protein [Oscillospiraceae bacterium]
MAFWTEKFMGKMRTEWLRRLEKIQYYAGGKWYDAVITDKAIEGDTLKIWSQTMDSESLTITGLRILDTSGDVAGQISENLVKTSTQGVVTLWEFPLYEITG